MAIDHESPFKEIRLKSRRTMSCGGPEPEEEEEEEEHAAAASDPEMEEKEPPAHGERWPRWLRPLLAARFYTACEAHPSSRRGGERTMFCLDCAAAGSGALCLLCVAHGHLGHRAIQIRRSTYNSVVRVSDIRGLLDVDGVQTYVINGARVVFINERRPRHNHKGAGYRGAKGCFRACETCARGLHDVFRFCSLGCKVAAGCDAANQSSTPPPSPSPAVPAKRRKGIPRRAPFR